MANEQNHFTLSVFLGLAYAFTGVIALGMYYELAALGLAAVIIAGILPDIDMDSGSQAREVSALLAAIAPIALIEYFPGIKAGGMTRIALTIVLSYLITRVFITRLLLKWTKQQGMMHSIPAAIITFQLVYLFFSDLFWQDRLFIAGGAFIGFMAHLFLEASAGLDLMGKAMGKGGGNLSTLKLSSSNWGINVSLYASIAIMSFFIAKDFYPALKIYAGVDY